MAGASFEYEIYKTDVENASKTFGELEAHFGFCEYHDDSDYWATSYHLLTNPVYYYNYLLGELIGTQWIAHLRRNYGGIVDNKESTEYLINSIYKKGAKKEWFEIIKDATGEELNMKYFIESLRPPKR